MQVLSCASFLNMAMRAGWDNAFANFASSCFLLPNDSFLFIAMWRYYIVNMRFLLLTHVKERQINHKTFILSPFKKILK